MKVVEALEQFRPVYAEAEQILMGKTGFDTQPVKLPKGCAMFCRRIYTGVSSEQAQLLGEIEHAFNRIRHCDDGEIMPLVKVGTEYQFTVIWK